MSVSSLCIHLMRSSLRSLPLPVQHRPFHQTLRYEHGFHPGYTAPSLLESLFAGQSHPYFMIDMSPNMDGKFAEFLDLEPVSADDMNMDRDGTCFVLNHAEQQHLLAGVKEDAASITAQDRGFVSVEFLDPSLARTHEIADDGGTKVPARARSRRWCLHRALRAHCVRQRQLFLLLGPL